MDGAAASQRAFSGLSPGRDKEMQLHPLPQLSTRQCSWGQSTDFNYAPQCNPGQSGELTLHKITHISHKLPLLPLAAPDALESDLHGSFAIKLPTEISKGEPQKVVLLAVFPK